jgi:capsular polysaccharide biosynthesis protein
MARDSRHLRNRARIEALASAAGYCTVYPERLPLPDQIALFATATHIAGEYGSALHLALFAPPGSITCALRGASHHPGFVQSSLAAAFNQQIGYVLGHTPEHAGDHPFEIEPDAFSRALESMELCGPRL